MTDVEEINHYVIFNISKEFNELEPEEKEKVKLILLNQIEVT